MRLSTPSALFILATAASAANIAWLSNGPFQGTNDGTTVSYLGIPYAVAPIGPLRFMPPQTPAPYVSRTRMATSYGPSCPQISAPGTGVNLNMSEDCLTVNVFHPAENAWNLPVLVFIHGGGINGRDFKSGGSSDPLYDGRALVATYPHAVIVTFNYRLGVFGFMGGNDLMTATGGNLNPGLLDQVAVFNWVRYHIGQFGGNTKQVTAMGHSAGAISIGAHLLANGGNQNLFDRAILLSGGPGILYQTAQTFDVVYQYLVSLYDCTGKATSVACLQGANYLNILSKSQHIEYFPIIDGSYVKYQGLVSELGLNAISKVPLLIMNVIDEGTVAGAAMNITNDADANTFRRSFFTYLNSAQLDQLSLAYPDQDYNDNTQKAGDFSAAFSYECPATMLAAVNTINGVETYRGVFSFYSQRSFYGDRYSGKNLGVYHASELPYIFQYYPMLAGQVEINHAYKFLNALMTFVKGSQPTFQNGNEQFNWPLYGPTGITLNIKNYNTHVWNHWNNKCNMMLSASLGRFSAPTLSAEPRCF